MHNKTPRPTRRIRTARSHFKTCWEKQDKTYSWITRRQDLQDAFEQHAPISRRVQKTRQDVFVRNKTPRPTRRIRTARSHFKRRSEKQDKTYLCITRRQDLQDAFERHAPISRRIGKNKTRRIRAKQDAKTYKTHSNGTLPFQDAFRKTIQDLFVHNKTPRPTRRIRTVIAAGNCIPGPLGDSTMLSCSSSLCISSSESEPPVAISSRSSSTMLCLLVASIHIYIRKKNERFSCLSRMLLHSMPNRSNNFQSNIIHNIALSSKFFHKCQSVCTL